MLQHKGCTCGRIRFGQDCTCWGIWGHVMSQESLVSRHHCPALVTIVFSLGTFRLVKNSPVLGLVCGRLQFHKYWKNGSLNQA